MNNRLEHYVSQDPFNPMEVEKLSPEQEKFYMASQWRMTVSYTHLKLPTIYSV